MKNKATIIMEFEQFLFWIQQFKLDDHQTFLEPISEGKWSIAEILSHLMFWDRYFLQEILPHIRPGADIEFIPFQQLNNKSSIYALSGISMNELVEEVIHYRTKLVEKLREQTEEQFHIPFKLNGEEIDSYSGSRYTLCNYIQDSVHHDHHHQRQIAEFLKTIEKPLS
ncbi:DinB family protein [Risungbinella massiliensis]|uniref:DinB family protein n=1 Tax=Risungbinella massiliensis TaxID=1329796 RepID=UPI0005CBDA53|nr:DinB family protein [Risungbinella massiliensis]